MALYCTVELTWRWVLWIRATEAVNNVGYVRVG